ncbi:MAG: putative dehydrogenase [Candidatus Marivariicella framensis]|jgi:predicted dehydrogenase|tara:strand:- start:3622 stop:4581 length:960 start_codon:yes stop_codon:yes gene_type:complete
MLNIGVFGAGHLGKIHLKLLSQSKQYNLIGFYDSNLSNAKKVSENFDYKFFESAENLISKCDVIDIVTPTPFHHKIAILALSNNCHVFIEKPITKSVKEAKELINLSKLNGLYGQVGHVERFNPAFIAAKSHITKPMFIETHRLAEFNPRGTDVPVVLDLMIHDIDIILSLVRSPIKSINASGVKVISNTPDIANARIEFENGCFANLTASRISMKNMRKSRFFQKDAYISIDFLKKQTEIVKMKDAQYKTDDLAMILENAEGVKRQLYFEKPEIEQSNAILNELESFANSINNKQKPIVDLNDGCLALNTAQKIMDSY